MEPDGGRWSTAGILAYPPASPGAMRELAGRPTEGAAETYAVPAGPVSGDISISRPTSPRTGDRAVPAGHIEILRQEVQKCFGSRPPSQRATPLRRATILRAASALPRTRSAAG